MLSIYAVLVNCYDFTFHTPVTFMSPNDFLRGYLRIDLGRLDVGVTQNTAYTLYRHTLAESQGCESMS